MSTKWEQFAKENAEFYVYSVDVDFSTAEGQVFFFQSGKEDTNRIMAEASNHMSQGMNVAVAFGCGIGRPAIPMAQRFKRVIGVDVSPTMLAKLDENCRRFRVTNVDSILSDGEWDNVDADFVYSWLVFQHIEDWSVIDSTFKRIAGALSDDGVCYAQFDTRPRTLSTRLKEMLPDAVLPRTMRRGIRRIRRPRSQLVEMLSRHRLAIAAEYRPGTSEHSFVLIRSKN